MSNPVNARRTGAVKKRAVLWLHLGTVTLIAVELCFVYYLHQLDLPEAASRTGSGFLAVPPWHRELRFEVTLLLTILAGLLFSACLGLRNVRSKKADFGSTDTAISAVKQRVRTATAMAALTGADLALLT